MRGKGSEGRERGRITLKRRKEGQGGREREERERKGSKKRGKEKG